MSDAGREGFECFYGKENTGKATNMVREERRITSNDEQKRYPHRRRQLVSCIKRMKRRGKQKTRKQKTQNTL